MALRLDLGAFAEGFRKAESDIRANQAEDFKQQLRPMQLEQARLQLENLPQQLALARQTQEAAIDRSKAATSLAQQQAAHAQAVQEEADRTLQGQRMFNEMYRQYSFNADGHPVDALTAIQSLSNDPLVTRDPYTYRAFQDQVVKLAPQLAQTQGLGAGAQALQTIGLLPPDFDASQPDNMTRLQFLFGNKNAYATAIDQTLKSNDQAAKDAAVRSLHGADAAARAQESLQRLQAQAAITALREAGLNARSPYTSDAAPGAQSTPGQTIIGGPRRMPSVMGAGAGAGVPQLYPQQTPGFMFSAPGAAPLGAAANTGATGSPAAGPVRLDPFNFDPNAQRVLQAWRESNPQTASDGWKWGGIDTDGAPYLFGSGS